MRIKAFIYHKRAEKYSDCQDWFGINTQTNRIAVSDGMSQSIFSSWWAKILVDYYLENGHIPDEMHPLQHKWQQMLSDEIVKREEEAKTNPKRSPWRLKNSYSERSGAAATLCGLSLIGDKWMCECIGDSCLIVVNHDYTLEFYTSQVGEFNNHPDFLDSFGDGRGTPIKKEVKQDIKALLMVTDPFAELFQKEKNNQKFIKARLEELCNLCNHNTFIHLVEKWRDDFEMHNDDSTMILITECSNPEIGFDHKDDIASLCENELMSTKERCLNKFVLNTEEPCNTANQEEGKEEKMTEEEAKSNFLSSLEALLRFYSGKRSSNGIYGWIRYILKPVVDSFKKS